MKYQRKVLSGLVFSLTIVWCILLLKPSLFAATSESIDAEVALSVCGNNIVEGGEECEGENLNGKSCSSIGFSEGTLLCDVSCSFNTSGCISSSPPTSTPIPASNQNQNSDISTDQTITPTPQAFPVLTNNASPVNQTDNTISRLVGLVRQNPVIAELIRIYDANGNGILESSELFPVVNTWVQNWQTVVQKQLAGRSVTKDELTSCDVNADESCNLRDLSVLFYYIDR